MRCAMQCTATADAARCIFRPFPLSGPEEAFRSLKHASYALDATHQSIHLGTGVIKREAGPTGALNAQAVHERFGTMVPGAHSDAQAVEQRAHIQVVYIAHLETYHGIVMLWVCRTKDMHTPHLRHLLHSVAGKITLVSLYLLHSQ